MCFVFVCDEDERVLQRQAAPGACPYCGGMVQALDTESQWRFCFVPLYFKTKRKYYSDGISVNSESKALNSSPVRVSFSSSTSTNLSIASLLFLMWFFAISYALSIMCLTDASMSSASFSDIWFLASILSTTSPLCAAGSVNVHGPISDIPNIVTICSGLSKA